ncbi:MAG: hypothetical protein M0Q93_00155 [Terrimicrobiaceae bacterium]|jgi:hypothetical protein|nr:hypothetical protein [Terrimicrobiaceae bacterium]
MRCPDCNKFTGLENQDPEINSFEASFSGTAVLITAEVRAVRACADCSTELKSIDLNLEESFEVCTFEGFNELPEPNQLELLNLVENEDDAVTVEVEEKGGESEDGGGGRYKKNIITTVIHGTITLTWERGKDQSVTLTKSIDLQGEEAAGAYEEC